MRSRYRNELTVVPPVKISVSRRGLTTTIGWNTGYAGHSIAGASGRELRHVGDYALSGPLPTDRFLIPGTRQDFGGGNVADMTSPGLSSFKAMLDATRQRDIEIRADIRKARREVAIAWIGRALGWASLTSAFLPSVRRSAGTALTAKRSDVSILRSNLAATGVSVNFDMETEIAGPHRRMQAALDALNNAQRVWTVQTEQQINRVKARSFAGTVVARAAARLSRRTHNLVITDDIPHTIGIQNGRATVYFYPGFLLIAGSSRSDEFALVDMRELEVRSENIAFTETEAVPLDARRVGVTWAKANKNGSRDKRFAHNRELPIMAYGGLHLTCPGGLNEKLMVSHAEVGIETAVAFAELKRVLMSGATRQRLGKQTAIGSPARSHPK